MKYILPILGEVSTEEKDCLIYYDGSQLFGLLDAQKNRYLALQISRTSCMYARLSEDSYTSIVRGTKDVRDGFIESSHIIIISDDILAKVYLASDLKNDMLPNVGFRLNSTSNQKS